METGKKLWIVSKVSINRQVKVFGVEADLKLSRADNMIGVCPVFDDYDKAVEYVGGEEYVEELEII